jgi:hypothetical protein
MLDRDPIKRFNFAFILCPPKPLPLPLFCARPSHYLCLYFVPAQAITFAFILCPPKPGHGFSLAYVVVFMHLMV